MTAPSVIRVLPLGERLIWIGEDAAVHSGSLDQLRLAIGQPSKPLPIDLIVPGEAALTLVAEIPSANRSKVLQAMPYAVEEFLALPIEQYHLALGQAVADQAYWVAAVERSQMQQWLELLSDLPLRIKRIVPDSLLLEATPAAHLWIEADRLLLRSPTRAYAGDRNEIEALLQLSEVVEPLQISEWSGQSPWDGQRRPTAGDPTANLVATLNQGGAPVNLIQGQFNRAEEGWIKSQRWLRYAAIIAGFALGLEATHRVSDLLQAKQRYQQATEQSAQLLRGTFPDVQRVVNPRAQMEQRINALGGSDQLDFLGLLRQAGAALSSETIEIRDLNYRAGSLELRVSAKNFDEIEAISQQLGLRGLSPAVDQVMTLGDATSAQLRISGAAL